MSLHEMMDFVTVEKGNAMAEYIDKEALRDALYDADAITMNGVKILNQFPAADVEPVKHGRWVFGKDLPYSWGQIPKNKYHLYCSECLEQAFNRSEDNDPDFDVDTPYCPNCGAKMDGE